MGLLWAVVSGFVLLPTPTGRDFCRGPRSSIPPPSALTAPTAEELTNENIVKIVNEEVSDSEVNELVWRCLGYREDASEVFPKWAAKYPEPPDLVGVSRVYSKDVDEPVLRANQALVASIPMAYKAGIKEHLSKVGFTGFKLEGLTPNKTRRAQCANWLLFYREALFGKSLEELVAAKSRDVEAENQQLREEGKSLKVATGTGVVGGTTTTSTTTQTTTTKTGSSPDEVTTT